MKIKITLMVSVTFLLLTFGIAGAQQTLLSGDLIPKFVDELPVAGDISVVYATTPETATYNIHLREFQAQILPSMGVPDAVPPILPNTPSWVWGYLTDTDVASGGVRPSYLGPVVIARRGVTTSPTYLNELPYPAGNVQMNLPVDMTLDWANPLDTDCRPSPRTGDYLNPVCGMLPYTGPWPSAVHIHGGEVAPAFDGGPDAWNTPIASGGPMGMAYPGNTYTYPNGQEEGTIWFHPHEFGVTRLGVYAGMAGLYPIVDPGGPSAPVATASMPAFPAHDIPLIIQDRSFDTTGQLFYNLASNPQPNPTVHPFWIPEFIGDTICVNGKTWPYLEVERRQYRFRLLNGSNARFYELTLDNGRPFIAIATDDGYLNQAVSTPNIVIGPGERYEVIVDFRGLADGTEIIMMNSAGTPFPLGNAPITNLTDTVMKFIVDDDETDALDSADIADGTQIRQADLVNTAQGHVVTAEGTAAGADPGVIVRQLTLNEVIGLGGPLELVVNNSKYNLKSYDPVPSSSSRIIPVLPGCSTPLCRETELPAVGDTEIWEIINISADAHPMHTHLTSFKVLDRTPFDAAAWIIGYDAALVANGVSPGGGPPNQYNVLNADGAIGGNPPVNAFLDLGLRADPEPYEMGWKDTVIAYPGEVTRILVRWAPQDAAVGTTSPGVNTYPFDPTVLQGGVGYVWHCHILDHEDNEMMRNYTVGNARQPVVDLRTATSPDLNADGCVDRSDLSLLLAAISAGAFASQYDLNQDLVLNRLDINQLTGSYTLPGGRACP